MRVAERGILELQQYVHTLIVIPNQNLFRVANDRTTMAQAFAMADEVLHAGVRGVTDLIVMPGLINLDFADIKSVISEMGKAMMGTGEAEGEDRAMRAADMAISNPLLDDVTMKGAKGVLINITGGPDLMLFEVEQAANRIRAEVDPDANIIFGNTILDDMEGRIRVSVVATGIDAELSRQPLPEKVTTHARFKAGAPKVEATKPAYTLAQQSASVMQAVATPVPQAPVQNQVHATMDALATEMGIEKSPAEAYILGGEDAPEIATPATKYAATESYRPLTEQPLAPKTAAAAAPEKKSGWGFFGKKKTASDLRAEPAPEPRANAPRATAQTMPQPQMTPSVQPGATPSSDDLFPDHKRDEQFEIPAFLRRQNS
jgi:cell division protein FtsZ